MQPIKTIIFDLGAVLIDWHPDHLYKKHIPSAEERNWFYENICTSEWNEEQDAGRSLSEATQLLLNQYPEHAEIIRMYYDRWEEMLNGPIQGTVEILRTLKEKDNYQLIALTNWSAETFPIALEKYDFLHWFHGRVVSGEEKTRKPFTDIYQTLLDRYNVNPREAIFVDDNKRNLGPAEALGIKTIHFVSPEQFKEELTALGIL